MAFSSIFQQVLAVLLLFNVKVYAGHPLWEHGHIAFSNKTYHSLEERAFQISPSDHQSIWPNSEIKYCFDTTAAKNKLDSNIEAAMAVWYARALPSSFKMTLVSDSDCKANRPRRLLVSETPGVLSTTPGLQLPDQVSGFKGPVMRLTTDTTIGSLDVVGNVAHEIGHAWGLLHPHQVATLYEPPMGSGLLRSFLRFNCENLKDYQKFYEIGKANDDLNYINKLCTDYGEATRAGFSASEFTTMGGMGAHDLAIPTDDAIDWDSIMFYPTGAGGRGTASPGNDQRLPVLERIMADGSIANIPIRLVPSSGDVEALKSLYEAQGKSPTSTLLLSSKHPRWTKFKQIVQKTCKIGPSTR